MDDGQTPEMCLTFHMWLNLVKFRLGNIVVCMRLEKEV